MFGTLRPPRCGAQAIVETYRRYYCGTCQGIGAHFGHARRALLSHDAVFMALLADAAQAEAAPPSRCRCPLLPVVFRETLAPSSAAMRFAVAVQMLLADQWLADRGADGRWTARLARPLVTTGPAQHASAMLEALGVDLRLHGFETRQLEVEANAPAPEVAASPTAAVLAAAFEAVGTLPGVAAAFEAPQVRASLAELGADTGTLIYLIDALEDVHEDARSGDFNPCLDANRIVCASRIEQAASVVRAASSRAFAAIEALPWCRHGDVLAAILRAATARSRRAISTARGLERRPVGLGAAWAWGLSWTAPTTGMTDVPGDVPPDVGGGRLDVGPGATPDAPVPPDVPHGGCSACDGCGRQCSRACADWTRGCEGCCAGFEGCLSRCGRTCTPCVECPGECGRACGDCSGDGDACCRGCDDCGRCCQGCEDCGQSCQGC